MHWSKLQEKGTVVGMKFMLRLYQLCGRIPFLIVLYPVVLYYYLATPVARNASLSFLRQVHLSQGEHPGPGIYWLSFRHFLTFAQGLLDKLIAWLGAIQYDAVDFPDQPFILDLIKRRQGAVFLGSHLGNLEVMRALSTYNMHIRLNIFVHTKHAEKFNQLLQATEDNLQLNMLQVSEITPATAMMMQAKLAAGEFIVIVGDRIPIESAMPGAVQRTSVVDFLGRPAEFPQGPFLLAALLKCPVYSLFCLRKGQRYQIKFGLFAERIELRRGHRDVDIQPYIQRYADILAAQAVSAPLQWYNFYPFWLAPDAEQQTHRKHGRPQHE